MRMKQVIRGLNNSQKIRVIVNGVGFNTTVLGMTEMCFTDQRIAVWQALERIAMDKIQGFAGRTRVYDDKMRLVEIDVQVDLI